MEFDPAIPIYLQVVQEIKKEMLNGQLPPGSKMVSARELAIRYQINPNTANRIYKELELEQLCFTRRGLGTFVTEDHNTLAQIRQEMAQKTLEEFVNQMKSLGFTREELLSMVEEIF